MSLKTELQKLILSKRALESAMIAGGCDVEDKEGLTEFATSVADRFNDINNKLIQLTGTNDGTQSKEYQYEQILKDIQQVLNDYEIQTTSEYDDLPDTIAQAFNDYEEGTASDIKTQYLNDITEVLTDLGIETTDSFADLANIIRTAFEEIETQLEALN